MVSSASWLRGEWTEPASSDPSDILESLAKVQLPPVGVSSPLLLWNSPNSPNPSNVESSISSEKEEVKVNGSDPLIDDDSEKGPKPSCNK